MENNYNLATVNNEQVMTPTITDDGLIADLSSAVLSYCSMKAETAEEKKALFNVQNSTAEKIADHVNETMNLRHVYVETVSCMNEETGEVTICPRIVLIDDKGNGFGCVSRGIYSALRKLFGIFGTPDAWEKPIKIKFKSINKDKFRVLSFDIV